MNKDELEIETVKDCPILYSMIGKSHLESCYYGWEFDHGWDRTVSNMSYKLEALNNIFYPKYRARIQIDQLKEKYGQAHFYWTVVVDPSKFKMFWKNLLMNISKQLNSFDFNMKKVIDIEPYDYDDVKEITKEEYKKRLLWKACNEDLEVKDGKYYRTLHLRNYGKQHLEPTNWKMFFKLKNVFRKWSNSIYAGECSAKTHAAVVYLEHLAKNIISDAEHECDSICEHCGNQIDTDWSPACQTHGWITYLCKSCAEKQDSQYYMNGALMHKGEVIKTAEQVKAEKEEAEAKYHANQKLREEAVEKKMKEIEEKLAHEDQK